MNVKTDMKICTNCNKAYSEGKTLPLCSECMSEFDGYELFIAETKSSSIYEPHRASDGPVFANRI
jgi:predicted amidophosphoribosyltransferase